MIEQSTIEQGEQAPAQRVSGADGAVIDLAAPGRTVVLYFYPKDDTSGCTREAQDFTALAGEFAAANVAVVGVSRDSAASHAKFTAKYDLAVPLHSDADGALSDAFGVWVEKSMYGRKYMGMERATFLIAADGRVARAWRKVKVPGHAAAVLEAARAL
jgi:peroxiredoxin Q/BCP